jgi:integrase
MAYILPTEKACGLGQQGGWQQAMARRRYQQGSIRKRGQRRPVWELLWWEDVVGPDGRIVRRRKSVILGPAGQLTLRQARKLAEEHLRPLNQGKILPQSTITFGEFVERYYVPHALPALKSSTRQRYRQTFKHHLLPAFGKWRLTDLSALAIQQYALAKMDSGLSWEMASHFRNLISAVFSAAKQWGYFPGENPARGVRLPEKKAVREKHALTLEQIQRLLGTLADPARTIFLVGILTGMRIGEILGLRWQDVDFASGRIHIRQACYRGQMDTPKTQASRRVIPLPRQLAEALLRFRKGEAGDGLVFHSSKGTPLGDTNLLHRQLKPAGARLGMTWLSWHALRRTHATLFQAVGGTLREAQAQLGHSRMATTLEIYTVPLAEAQRRTVQTLADLATNGDELGRFPAWAPPAA